MLSGLPKKKRNNSAPESSENTECLSSLADHSWQETADDVITAGSEQSMSHQERYEFVKNRKYYPLENAFAQDQK